MTPKHPLFEFMPYGAPELLSQAERRLLSAQILGSLIVCFIVLLIGGVIPRIPSVAKAPPVEVEILRLRNWVPEVARLVQPPPRARPARSEETARIVPVEAESILEPEVYLPPLAGAPTGTPGEASDVRHADGGREADGDRPYTTAGLPQRGEYTYHEQAPSAVSQMKPDYPGMARDAGVEGRVLVHVLVGTDGRVVRAEVDDTYQIPLLNAVARDAALQWVFTPALANRHAVAVWVSIPFDFRLR
jgi:protein TonB